MFRRIAEYVRESPVLSGGLTVYAVVVALAIIFAIGVLAGVVNQRVTTADQMEATGSALSETSVAAQDGASEATASGEAAPGMVTEPAQGQQSGSPSGQGGVTPVKSASVDVKDASRRPSEQGHSPRAKAWLKSNFGVAVAPDSAAGLTRSQIGNTETTVTATYIPSGDSPLDSVRLVVYRLPRNSKSEPATEQLLDGFGEARLVYDWGDREVTQGLTAEGRPEVFPPAVCLVWLRDGFGVQVTAIPREPGLVTSARAQSLAFVSALPY